MLMFIMHISTLLALGVLLASTSLIIWSLRNGGAGINLAKSVGSAVFTLSLLSLLCIGYYSVKYWHYESPMSMPMHKEMMEKMMPMMMGNMMGKMGRMIEQKDNDPASHHPN